MSIISGASSLAGRRFTRNRTNSMQNGACAFVDDSDMGSTASAVFSDKPDRAFIEHNLKNLQEKSEAKRIAQELYYANANGCSPMLRGNRRPVRERLGQKRRYNYQQRNNFLPLGTNTSSILPKNRYQQNRNRTQFGRFSAQNRISRIRQQQRLTRNYAYQNTNQLVNNNQIINNNNNRPFRLRRTLPQSYVQTSSFSQMGNDLTISVNNTMVGRRFRMYLNPQVQEKLREIRENTFQSEEYVLDGVPLVHCTGVLFTDRFSRLL